MQFFGEAQNVLDFPDRINLKKEEEEFNLPKQTKKVFALFQLIYVLNMGVSTIKHALYDFPII